jgi:hypothetical protein
MSFLHLCSVSGQQVQGSKQSHNNLGEAVHFCNIRRKRQVFQNNSENLMVFSIRDYAIYTLFVFIATQPL